MTIIGIDPGVSGAVAVLDPDGRLIKIMDMPATKEANGRSATNAPLLASMIAETHASLAYVELVGPMPKEGVVGAFSFGRCRGVIEGVCGALDVRVVFVTPPVWKRIANIPPGKENKDLARTRAIARWPASADLFARKKDQGRAEAALIAVAGLHREGKGQ